MVGMNLLVTFFSVCLEVEQIGTVPSGVTSSKVMMPVAEETENVTRWIVDQNFRRDQERLKIPFGKWLPVFDDQFACNDESCPCSFVVSFCHRLLRFSLVRSSFPLCQTPHIIIFVVLLSSDPTHYIARFVVILFSLSDPTNYIARFVVILSSQTPLMNYKL